MPVAECQCFSCDKFVSYQHICGHLMTHKAALIPLLTPNIDLFSTLHSKDGKEVYHCCFGCKKMMKDRVKMRRHMKESQECCAKHIEYLRDIGVNVEEVKVEQNKNSDNETIKALQIQVDGLRELLDEYKDGYQMKRLEEELGKAQRHINRLEEFYQLIPHLMSDADRKYCHDFVRLLKTNKEAIYDGHLRKQRHDELLTILQRCPLLQLFFCPTFSFLTNQHFPDGTHQGILSGCGYWTGLNYSPRDAPTEYTLQTKPSLPVWDGKKDEGVESVHIPTQEQILQANTPQSSQPKLLQSTKRTPKQV